MVHQVTDTDNVLLPGPAAPELEVLCCQAAPSHAGLMKMTESETLLQKLVCVRDICIVSVQYIYGI